MDQPSVSDILPLFRTKASSTCSVPVHFTLHGALYCFFPQAPCRNITPRIQVYLLLGIVNETFSSYHRPQTKLREGDVFTDVCLSKHVSQTCHLGYPSPATDIWLSSLETCSNVFTTVLTHSGSHKTRTVGKRAVRILLECFLVYD